MVRCCQWEEKENDDAAGHRRKRDPSQQEPIFWRGPDE